MCTTLAHDPVKPDQSISCTLYVLFIQCTEHGLHLDDKIILTNFQLSSEPLLSGFPEHGSKFEPSSLYNLESHDYIPVNNQVFKY